MAAITQQELRRLNSTVGASETDTVVAEFSVDWESALHFRLDVVCSSVTVASGITVQVQDKALGGSYEDLSSANSAVAITGNGTFSITLLLERAADQVDLPLKKSCRLVCTTGAGDTVTFDTVSFQHR